MLYAGPLILGFILGFIIGSRIKIYPESKLNFTLGSYLVIFIAALVTAYLIGPFPYYTDGPFASGFLATIIGLLVGKITLGRDVKEKKEIKE
ncbi:MAG: energy-converting hydrogenase B subunit J [Methanobacterium sp.]|nr:energy-converting hydrogenase B subunit J [Methanobacterium sp.]